jgi:hypothetical protein
MIILGVMGVAILFGTYELFFAKGKKPVTIDAGKNITELNTFISEMTAAIGKDTPSPVDAYMIKRAEAGWARDPFYERKTYKDWAVTVTKEPAQAAGAGGAPTQKNQFNYTGYVALGNKQIAIINGIEYGVGDALDVEGYILKGIHPSRVVIFNKESKRYFDVPLQD